MIVEYLARARMRLEEDLDESELKWKFSPVLFDLYRKAIPVMRQHAKGDLLDVGAGRMPFRPYLEDRVRSYDGLDIERRSPQTRFIGDAQDMKEIADASYDTVISASVLEHMPQPWKAIDQMRRVCRPGGTIILIVPLFSRLHEEPHDYFRFTPHGLKSLAERSDLEVVSVQPVSGLFTFAAHQVSSLVVCMFWAVPLVKWLIFWINYCLVVRPALFLDRILKTERKYPTNILGVLRVKGPST